MQSLYKVSDRYNSHWISADKVRIDSKKRSRTSKSSKAAAKSPNEKIKEEDEAEDLEEEDAPAVKRSRKGRKVIQDDEEDEVMEDAPSPKPKAKKDTKPTKKSTPAAQKKKEPSPKPEAAEEDESAAAATESASEAEPEAEESGEDEKPEVVEKARKTVQTKLTGKTKDPYPDWKPGEPVPYAALCQTFSLVELTTKRLEIMAHCSLFLRQVLRLTPDDMLPTVLLMINKLAPDYSGIELGIGESLIMKAIGESTGRSLQVIKNDQKEIGDLGLVAVKSRSTQPTMFKPKPLTVRGVHKGLMGIATVTGNGAQGRKVDGIKKLLSAADSQGTGKVDITKDKGGPSEAKYIIRFLEGKLRLGLAEKTVLVSLAQAMICHEAEQKGKVPSTTEMEKAEATLKTVYSELPSYDVIIPAMLEHGILNLRENCKLRPGVPLKPMLAKPTKAITEVLDRFEGQNFTCEYKYDGERAQIHYVAKDANQELSQATAGSVQAVGDGVASIFSRNSEDLSKKYPDILAKLHTWVKEDTKSFVLDCETVAWDTVEKKVLPFQQLMTRKKKDVKVEDVKVKVCVFAFDLLYLNGEAIVEKSLRERRELLSTAFAPVEGEFAFAVHMNGKELDEIQQFLDESVKASCEGLMVKMLDGEESGYEPSKRSRNWLKVSTPNPPTLTFPACCSPRMLTLHPQNPDQERLPLRRGRLARPRRAGRLLRQGQAHLRVRGLPPGVLQPRVGHVRDGVQHRDRIQRGGSRGAAQVPVGHGHRPPQALLRALVGGPAPARRVVRAPPRLGGAHRRPDAQPPVQGRRQGGGRPGGREGHLAAVPAVYQGPRRQEA